MNGCTQKAKITDAENYIAIQKQVMQLNQQSKVIKENKDNLLAVSSVYDENTVAPESKINFLTRYLDEHDCTVLSGGEKDSCYKETVVLLIVIAKLAEEKEYDNYLLNSNITRLKHNFEFMIDRYPTFSY